MFLTVFAQFFKRTCLNRELKHTHVSLYYSHLQWYTNRINQKRGYPLTARMPLLIFNTHTLQYVRLQDSDRIYSSAMIASVTSPMDLDPSTEITFGPLACLK